MMENEKDILFDNIEASLRYGALELPKIFRVISWCFAVMWGLIIPLIILFFFAFEEPLVLIGMLIPLLLALIHIFIILYLRKRKAKIELWLKDAVLIKARCSLLGKMPKEETDELMIALDALNAMASKGADLHLRNPRILVTFKYNGKTVRRMSGKQGYSDEEMVTGRDPIFKKYIGRRFDILYSPKYDEVLLLKLNAEE